VSFAAAMRVLRSLDNEDHADASLANIESWVARLPGPTYAIDDQTAVRVTDNTVEVVSEGHWKLITCPARCEAENAVGRCRWPEALGIAPC
jgi:hypothetical protein